MLGERTAGAKAGGGHVVFEGEQAVWYGCSLLSEVAMRSER